MQKLPTKWEDREELREKGQFWTPEWVAKAMVSYVAQDTDLIYDPATGNGSFLAALDSLDLPNVNYLGGDIDDSLLELPIYQQSHVTVEHRDFILEASKQKFKSIIANPPYIRHHRLSPQMKEKAKAMSYNATGNHIDARAGLHIYFLIQALCLLEQGGRLAFIVPADTCEGHFAKTLWDWIFSVFKVECAITFDEKATPFPGVDTNAVVLLIRNESPADSLKWVRVSQESGELLDFIKCNFEGSGFHTLTIHNRDIQEAKLTGLSRPPRCGEIAKHNLGDFAKVMRGIATGANEFFLMNSIEAKQTGIPDNFFKRVVGRTRDINSAEFTETHLNKLDESSRPTFLLSLEPGHRDAHPNITSYLVQGETMGLPERALIQQRQPWYKMEQRTPPPLLFTYLGRRNSRFVKNSASVLPLTGFLCVYPHRDDPDYVDRLWQALNHPDTIANLASVGKSYGSGAIKVEPGKLKDLPIPDHVVTEFELLA